MLGKPIPEYLLEYQPKGDPMMNLPVVKKVVGVSATKFIGGIKLSNTQEEDESAISSNEPENVCFFSYRTKFKFRPVILQLEKSFLR
jgi:hypothetical protein